MPEVRHPLDTHDGCVAAYRDPAMQDFLRHRWRGAYVGWLARHPVGVVREPSADLSTALTQEMSFYDRPRTVLPGPLQNVGFLPKVDNALVAIVLVPAFWLAAWWA